MKAQIIRKFGGPQVFESAEIAQPIAEAGTVVVRVKATSVNPVDFKIRSGNAEPLAPRFPAVLHGDVAGVIESVGAGVGKFKVGDEVYGTAGGVKGLGGALAEFMQADPDLLALKPRTLSFEQSAALPLVSITAWEALIDRAQIREGQKVLIHGGTGGVGHVAIQLAKSRGATVYTTVSDDDKAAVARKLGADFTINYKTEPVAEYVEKHTGGAGFEVVFDTIGGENLNRSFEAAAVSGRVAAITTDIKHDLSLMHFKGLTLHFILMLIPMLWNRGRAHHGEILAEVAPLADAGKLRALLDSKVFTLEEVSKAHERLESGRAIGKVVITI